MSNVIPHRIRDFLRQFPPFDRMGDAHLLAISHQVRVLFFHAQENIVPEAGALQGLCLVIREGAVSVFDSHGGTAALADKLQPGDWLNCRELWGTPSAKNDLVAAEDCLLYGLPRDLLGGYEWLPDRDFSAAAATSADVFTLRAVPFRRELVWCDPELSVCSAAQLMRSQGVGSVLVCDTKGLPVGILTDKDLRNRVATGEVDGSVAVGNLMSAPVVCARPESNIATLQLLMIEHRIGHVCVTADGSDQTPARGMVSEHDLLRLQSQHPIALAKALDRAESADELAAVRGEIDQLASGYLSGGISVAVVAQVVTMLNDKLLQRLLALVIARMESQGYGSAPCAFCWLALGSQGRSEQILRTDQDNALVYEDVPEEQAASTRKYFQEMAARTVEGLVICGFERCPAEMMASNPRWCQPLRDWKHQFSDWIFHPSPEKILLSNIFFDFRPLAGEHSLAEKLSRHIRQTIRQQSIFLSFMARDAVNNPPPLTFFRNFVLERSAEHKDQFDIKLRALLPLTDAARLLFLAADPQSTPTNTPDRFRYLAETDPPNQKLYQQAAAAYQILMHFRNTAGLTNHDSGRYFFPKELTSLERMTLKNCFQVIRDIQQLIQVRFQLALMS